MIATEKVKQAQSLGIFCTKIEGAQLLGVSRATFDRYRLLPNFPKARVLSGGHAIRFKTAELIQWLDSRTDNKE